MSRRPSQAARGMAESIGRKQIDSGAKVWPSSRLHSLRMNPSPVIALNRAVALARVKGPGEALAAVAAIEDDPSLANYYLLPSVKGRLLSELGDRTGAAAAYRDALARPCTEPERRFLLRRLEAS